MVDRRVGPEALHRRVGTIENCDHPCVFGLELFGQVVADPEHHQRRPEDRLLSSWWWWSWKAKLSHAVAISAPRCGRSDRKPASAESKRARSLRNAAWMMVFMVACSALLLLLLLLFIGCSTSRSRWDGCRRRFRSNDARRVGGVGIRRHRPGQGTEEVEALGAGRDHDEHIGSKLLPKQRRHQISRRHHDEVAGGNGQKVVSGQRVDAPVQHEEDLAGLGVASGSLRAVLPEGSTRCALNTPPVAEESSKRCSVPLPSRSISDSTARAMAGDVVAFTAARRSPLLAVARATRASDLRSEHPPGLRSRRRTRRQPEVLERHRAVEPENAHRQFGVEVAGLPGGLWPDPRCARAPRPG